MATLVQFRKDMRSLKALFKWSCDGYRFILNSLNVGSKSTLASRCGTSRASQILWMWAPRRGSDGPKIPCTDLDSCLHAEIVYTNLIKFTRKQLLYECLQSIYQNIKNLFPWIYLPAHSINNWKFQDTSWDTIFIFWMLFFVYWYLSLRFIYKVDQHLNAHMYPTSFKVLKTNHVLCHRKQQIFQKIESIHLAFQWLIYRLTPPYYFSVA